MKNSLSPAHDRALVESGKYSVDIGLVRKSPSVLTEELKLSQNRPFAVFVRMNALKETIASKRSTPSQLLRVSVIYSIYTSVAYLLKG